MACDFGQMCEQSFQALLVDLGDEVDQDLDGLECPVILASLIQLCGNF
jgi:hypothetical protein